MAGGEPPAIRINPRCASVMMTSLVVVPVPVAMIMARTVSVVTMPVAVMMVPVTMVTVPVVVMTVLATVMIVLDFNKRQRCCTVKTTQHDGHRANRRRNYENHC